VGNKAFYYYGARYYDPRISVFLGVDPMADKYPGWSPFTYCLNNPVKLIDPDGRVIYIWYTVKGNNGKETRTSFKFTGNNASSAPKNSFVQKAIAAYNYEKKRRW
jgi:uncharacterized protein RhaS with RHS repeats